MFCRFCGKVLEEGSSFCRFCGKRLVQTVEVLNPALDAKNKIIQGKYILLKLDGNNREETERIGKLYISRVNEILEKSKNTFNDREIINKIDKLLDLVIDMLDAAASASNESKKLDIETDIEALYNKMLADGLGQDNRL